MKVSSVLGKITEFVGTDLPGIIAFIRQILQDGKIKERVTRRYGDDAYITEVMTDIVGLHDEFRQAWLKKLSEARAVGKEDQYVWDLSRIDTSVRAELLQLLVHFNNSDFEAFMEGLRNNSIEQFLLRLQNRLKTYVVPVVEKAAEEFGWNKEENDERAERIARKLRRRKTGGW